MFVVAASCLGSSSGTKQSLFMKRCSIGRSLRAHQVIPTCFVSCRHCAWGRTRLICLSSLYGRLSDPQDPEGHGVRRDFLSTADWTRDEINQLSHSALAFKHGNDNSKPL